MTKRTRSKLPAKDRSVPVSKQPMVPSGEPSVLEQAEKKLELHNVRQLAAVIPADGEDPWAALEIGILSQKAIHPKDELESMLAAQMVAVHNLAMTCLGRANLTGQTTEGLNLNIERATKLLRTFTTQMESLNRHRGKGQQKVTVEHVTVNQGGQAIVGVVEKPGRGGGDGEK